MEASRWFGAAHASLSPQLRQKFYVHSVHPQYLPKRLLGISLLLASAGCSTQPPGPRDLLDEHTGVTVTVVGAPILFARVRYDGPVAVHDYMSLVAMQNDNAGKYTDLLLLYRWSEFSVGAPTLPDQNAGQLQMEIDGRSLELQPIERLPFDLPSPKVRLAPVAAEVVTHVYATDLETMRLIATSHEFTVRLTQESPNEPFPLWRDGRPALAQFVKQYSP